jgi:hypothetical protein
MRCTTLLLLQHLVSLSVVYRHHPSELIERHATKGSFCCMCCIKSALSALCAPTIYLGLYINLIHLVKAYNIGVLVFRPIIKIRSFKSASFLQNRSTLMNSIRSMKPLLVLSTVRKCFARTCISLRIIMLFSVKLNQ